MGARLLEKFRGLGTVGATDTDNQAIPTARFLQGNGGSEKVVALFDLTTSAGAGSCDVTPVYRRTGGERNTVYAGASQKVTLAAVGSYLKEFEAYPGLDVSFAVVLTGTNAAVEITAAYGAAQ